MENDWKAANIKVEAEIQKLAIEAGGTDLWNLEFDKKLWNLEYDRRTQDTYGITLSDSRKIQLREERQETRRKIQEKRNEEKRMEDAKATFKREQPEIFTFTPSVSKDLQWSLWQELTELTNAEFLQESEKQVKEALRAKLKQAMNQDSDAAQKTNELEKRVDEEFEKWKRR